MAKLSSHTLRTVSMPLGMVVGALFCRQIVALDSWSCGYLTPSLICIMLFFTYCRVDITKMRVTMMHFWLFAAQIVGSMAVYTLFQPLGQVVALEHHPELGFDGVDAVVNKLVPPKKAALVELNMKALQLGKDYK